MFGLRPELHVANIPKQTNLKPKDLKRDKTNRLSTTRSLSPEFSYLRGNFSVQETTFRR